MKKVLSLLMILALMLGLAACGGEAEEAAPAADATEDVAEDATEEATEDMPEINATLSLMLSDDHPQTIAVRDHFAPMVSELTDGKFIINVQNNGTMGSDAETTEAAIMGNMEMTLPAIATIASFDPNFYILDVPYVFGSQNQVRAALDGELGAFLSDSLESTSGLICLGYPESGMRNLSNNTGSVYSPDDIAGMKIRVLENKYHVATFEALGANPTPMAFSEVYTGLQTNQIDGQDNSVTITYTSKFHEVQDYYSVIEHLFNAAALLVNADWYNSLPAAYQEALHEAAAVAVTENRAIIDANEGEYLAAMEEAGTTINTLTAEEKQVFIDATQSVRDEFVAEFPESGQEMMDLAAQYAD